MPEVAPTSAAWSALYLDVMNVSLTREVLAYDYRVTGDNRLEKNPLDVPVVLPMLGVKGRY